MLTTPFDIHGVPTLISVAGTLAAMVTDVRCLKIYNILTLPMLGLGVAYHGIVNGWLGLTHSMLSASIGMGVLVVPFALGAMGAGDAKLVSALAAWLGAAVITQLLIVSFFAMALYSFLILLWQRRLSESWRRLKLAYGRLRVLVRRLAHDGELTSFDIDIPQASANQPMPNVIPFSVMIGIGLAVSLFTLK